MRRHDCASDRQVGHQLRRAGQHHFAITLKILKCGYGISQVLNNSFAHMALNALPNQEQTHRRQSRGNQQHGEQEPGAEPGPWTSAFRTVQGGLATRILVWHPRESAHEFVAHPVHGAEVHAYRVVRSRAPYPVAVRVYCSSDIHFRNVRMNSEHGYAVCDQNGCGTFVRAGKFPYGNSIEDVTHHLTTRERQFTVLDIPAAPLAPLPPAGPKPRKLEDGFFSISGAAVDPSGKLYFVDHHDQRIYAWSQAEGLTVERDNPMDAVNLAFDRAGDLLVLSSAGPEGTLYAFRPGSPKSELTVISPQAARPHPAARFILPVNYWNDGQFRSHLDPETLASKTLAKMLEEDVSSPKSREYESPDGSVVLPAFRVFQQGPADNPTGWRFSDALDTYGFVSAAPGAPVYVSNSSEDKTYRAVVKPDGALTGLQPFANRGGECVAVDARGNVYVANGQIFVYDNTGKLTGQIDVPERPIDIVFGGPDRKTLFILTHHALYAL